jgi:hypothetical protein
MSKYVEITSVTGSSPYNIYICDVDLINCTWISTITSGNLPYSFELPFIFSNYPNFAVKVVDSFNCNMIKFSGTTYPECP